MPRPSGEEAKGEPVPEINQQTIALAVVALLIVGPHAKRWVFHTLWPNSEKADFQKTTVSKLIDLRDDLEASGSTASAKLTRDLIVSLVNGEQRP
jgi:hypothetical protein